MGRISKSISFEEEDLPIINELLKTEGLLSNICREGIRNYTGVNIDLETAKNRLKTIENQMKSLKKDKKLFKNKLNFLQNEEKSKQKSEIEEIKKQESKLKEKKSTFMRSFKFLTNLDMTEAQYQELTNGDYDDIGDYCRKKNITIKI